MEPHIFYADGTVHTGSAATAPVRGVLCIVQTRPDNRNCLISRKSHYVHDGVSWIPCTWDDVEEYLLYRRETNIIVIRGMVVSMFEFDQVYQEAKKLV